MALSAQQIAELDNAFGAFGNASKTSLSADQMKELDNVFKYDNSSDALSQAKAAGFSGERAGAMMYGDAERANAKNNLPPILDNPATAAIVGAAKMMPFAEKGGAALASLVNGKSYDETRQGQQQTLNDIKAANPAMNASGNVVGAVLNPLNKAGLPITAAGYAMSDTPYNPITQTTDYAKDVGERGALNYAGGKILGWGANKLVNNPVQQATKYLSKFLPEGNVGAAVERNTELPIALSDKTGKAALLAKALANNKNAASDVGNLAQEQQSNLNDINKNIIQPLYTKVNNTPIPSTNTNPAMLGLDKSTMPEFESLLLKNPAIASAVQAVKNNMGEAAPGNNMSLLLKARQEVGDNLTARDTINNFIKQYAPDIEKADALHKNYFGSYDKNNISPQTALKLVGKGVKSGENKAANDVVGNISEMQGLSDTPIKLVKAWQVITGKRVPDVITRMSLNPAGQKELAKMLLKRNPEELQKILGQKFLMPGDSSLPYIGAAGINTLSNKLMNGAQ